jgi:hypothetical protein
MLKGRVSMDKGWLPYREVINGLSDADSVLTLMSRPVSTGALIHIRRAYLVPVDTVQTERYFTLYVGRISDNVEVDDLRAVVPEPGLNAMHGAYDSGSGNIDYNSITNQSQLVSAYESLADFYLAEGEFATLSGYSTDISEAWTLVLFGEMCPYFDYRLQPGS